MEILREGRLFVEFMKGVGIGNRVLESRSQLGKGRENMELEDQQCIIMGIITDPTGKRKGKQALIIRVG